MSHLHNSLQTSLYMYLVYPPLPLLPPPLPQSLAFLLSGIMDQGAQEYQLEAAISKIYSSVSGWGYACFI